MADHEAHVPVNLSRVLRAKPKALGLDNRRLRTVPVELGQLTFLQSLSLKNNRLTKLPDEIRSLCNLTYLNLGGNDLTILPSSLCDLKTLQTLHAFSNHLTLLPDQLLTSLTALTILNLNDNELVALPASIGALKQLRYLGAANNALQVLPNEIGALVNLTELHVHGNSIRSLPKEIGMLRKLQKLILRKNCLSCLPTTIGNCRALKILDVSSNEIEMFPNELLRLELSELYFEANPLLSHIPVPSEQQPITLPLQEIAARVLAKEALVNESLLYTLAYKYPVQHQMIINATICVVCRGTFINYWLECVKFVSIHEVLPLHNSTNQCRQIPIRTPLCSHKCFNAQSHEYLGVARTEEET